MRKKKKRKIRKKMKKLVWMTNQNALTHFVKRTLISNGVLLNSVIISLTWRSLNVLLLVVSNKKKLVHMSGAT